MKSLFEYDDYRKFLADYYQSSKERNKKFSFRFFSRIAGFKSSNFLQLVMKGKSNISPESAEQLAKAMHLKAEERLFFRTLVLFNQAKTSSERQRYSEELLRFKTYERIHPLSKAQYRYFDRWYYSIVRGLVGLPSFQENPAWIATQIHPAITPEEAKQALDELKLLGLIERDPSSLKLKQCNPNIASSDAITTSSLAQFHRAMAGKAAESIDRFPRDQRDLSATTLGVSKETLEKVKELANKFRLDVIELASQDPAPEALYQLNLYLFPVAGQVKGKP
jgi:uncharacterized protein (TIGR02147 family)